MDVSMSLRERVAVLVREYDDAGHPDGSFPFRELKDAAGYSFNKVIIEEEYPAPSGAGAIQNVLLRGLKDYPVPFAAACTAFTGDGSKLGKTFGIYFSKSGVAVVETHARCDPITRIPDRDGCVATLDSHDAHELANWLTTVHLPSIDCCSDNLDIVFVAHSTEQFWLEKVEAAVSKNEVLQKMVSLKPCMPKSLPIRR